MQMQTPIKLINMTPRNNDSGLCDTDRINNFPKLQPKLKIKADIEQTLRELKIL